MRKPNKYWNRDKCLKEAKKYNDISTWKIKSSGSYGSSRKNGWFNDCIQHMKITGSRYKRLIYAVEFSDNHAYIGLTFNIKKRKLQHLSPHNKSYVYKHISKTKLKPKFKILTDYLSLDDAKKYEEYYLNKYKENNWILLNKIKTGGLGGNIVKHTKDACILDALKYKTKNEWKKNSNSAYVTANKNGWIDDCCSHMILLRRRNGYWTLEKCKEDALKYNSRSEWRKKSCSASTIASKKGWIEECCKHMKIRK